MSDTQISKEAMEKAKFIANSLPPATINSLLVGGLETRDTLIDILALEFTNYQKRIDELEKDLTDVCEYTMHAMWCATLVPIINLKCNCGASDLHERIKSHLTKGVKEEG
jgi:hypothetical protein